MTKYFANEGGGGLLPPKDGNNPPKKKHRKKKKATRTTEKKGCVVYPEISFGRCGRIRRVRCLGENRAMKRNF